MSNPFIDLREQMKQMTLTVEKNYPPIKFKNKLAVFIGLYLIEWGCRLCGMNFKQEL